VKTVVTCTLVRAADTYLIVACEAKRPIKMPDWKKLLEASGSKRGLKLLPDLPVKSTAVQHFVGTFTRAIGESAILAEVTAFLSDNGFDTVVAKEISGRMQRILESF